MKVLSEIILQVTFVVVIGWICYAGFNGIIGWEMGPFPSWNWLGHLLALPVLIILVIPAAIYMILPLPKEPFSIVVFSVIGIGLFLITRFAHEINEREKRRLAEEAARQADEAARLQRNRDEQRRFLEQLLALCEESIDLFESLPRRLSSAEKYLDQAEVDFAEGAFAPFWDSIEKAATALGGFSASVHRIDKNASQYTEIATKYEGSTHAFPVSRQSIEKLTVATVISDRMSAIVRLAQRNFQFATIYEQRKTNQILVEGFTNLAQALDRMTRRISSSIDDLAVSVDQMTLALEASSSRIESRVGDLAVFADRHQEEWRNQVSNAATRELRALEMLDNIQRGRRPFP